MAGLLSGAQITALESIQSQMKSDYASIRGVLNTLANADPEGPENQRHNAFRALRATAAHIKGGIVDIENTVVSNEDDFGGGAG